MKIRERIGGLVGLSPGFGRDVVEQGLDPHFQDLRQCAQHAGAQPIGAGFIFLKLLMADAQLLAEI